MNPSNDTRETRLLAAGVAALPLLLAAGIGIVPQLPGVWLEALASSLLLIIASIAAIWIVRGARNLVLGQSVNSEIVGYKDDRETGVLLKGAIANVSLRVTTMHRIVDSLTNVIPESDRQDALYSCGWDVGRSWVSDFRHELPKLKIESNDIGRQILKWSEYDATAGMGRSTIAVNEDSGEGLAIMANSFLSRTLASFPLDWWFAGYLAGSLQELLGRAITVELIDPSSEPSPTALFRITPGGERPDRYIVPRPTRPPDSRSIARGKVWLRRLRTPLPDEARLD